MLTVLLFDDHSFCYDLNCIVLMITWAVQVKLDGTIYSFFGQMTGFL